MEEKIRQLLIGSGYTEIVNYSFENPIAADVLCLSGNDERRSPVRIKKSAGGRSFRYACNFDLWFTRNTAKRNANKRFF